jgi:Ca2+-binding RTX toxin-like protein
MARSTLSWSATVALLAIVAGMCAPAADARTLNGGRHADTLRGTNAADVIRGFGGNDRLFGRGGRDRLNGGSGNDRLDGGSRNDHLQGGTGRDVLVGGPGRDVLDCGAGSDRAVADAADVVFRNCERVSGRAPSTNPGPVAPPVTPPAPPAPSLAGDFSGTLTTTVRYLSVCTGQVLGDQTTEIPSRISIRPALVPNPADLPADVAEANPLNLVLGQTTAAGASAPGSINVASAARFRFSAIRSLTLQYWNLALAGTALTGTLVQDHREEGAAFNLLAAHQELVACQPQFGSYVNQLAIAEGATLTGTVTPQQVQLRVSGSTVDTFHQFVAEITAARSG